MKPPRPRGRRRAAYHHPDLKRALLDAAIAHFHRGDVSGLTMQTLARAAGVSPGAPYHHFPDKVAVVAELATEGHALWLEESRRIVAAGGSPAEQLAALVRAWLRFAAEHPSHYRVMFLPDVEDRRRFPRLHETSGRALAIFFDVFARRFPRQRPEARGARAIAVWSALHGFASLRGAGVFRNVPGLPELKRLERAAIELVESAL